jgi:hypothetical protein
MQTRGPKEAIYNLRALSSTSALVMHSHAHYKRIGA